MEQVQQVQRQPPTPPTPLTASPGPGCWPSTTWPPRARRRPCATAARAPPAQRVALRRTWAQLHHGLRLALAQHRMQRPPTSAQRRKVALQARVLGRDCCRSLHGAWPDWQAWLASGAPTPSNAPRLTLVHGRFDAVCAPANTRWLAALGNGGTKVQTTWVHSGHLAHEPAMHTALRAAVAVTAGAKAQP